MERLVWSDIADRSTNYCAGAAGAAGAIASPLFFAFLAMCFGFLAFFIESFAGAIASEAAGAAAAPAAGAVVSVWANAARGASAIAAEIPSAANVFNIVQSPCESFDSWL